MKAQNSQSESKKAPQMTERVVIWGMILPVLVWMCFLVITGGASGALESQGIPGIELSEPPLFPERSGLPETGEVENALGVELAPQATLDKFAYLPSIYNANGPLSVRPANRQESLDFYRKYYLTASINPGWTGNVTACIPGTTTQTFRDSLALRINYYRAMAGVAAKVTLLEEYNQKAQQAALMMSANNALSHNPPTSWKCYTDQGHEAAGSSNLALGGYGLDALRMYMQDFGSGNTAVGHRRWILYPQTQSLGTGDIPGGSGYSAANDLWVFDSHIWDARPATREAFVAWPPPGYVPYTVVYQRWSFSYAGADFSGAVVSMTENGSNFPVTRYTPVNGYGENTLVWIRTGVSDGNAWLKPAGDTTYVVTLSNVVVGGSPKSFQYTVIVFDPG
jgi:hypothetical protein